MKTVKQSPTRKKGQKASDVETSPVKVQPTGHRTQRIKNKLLHCLNKMVSMQRVPIIVLYTLKRRLSGRKQARNCSVRALACETKNDIEVQPMSELA